MTKVLRGIVTTTAVVALFVFTVYTLFFIDAEWFQDLTRWIFLHNREWFEARSIYLYDYRIICFGWILLFDGFFSIYAVGVVSDLFDAIVKLIFRSKKAA